MPFELPPSAKEQIERHGAEAYPNECCGFLLGQVQDSHWTAVDVAPVKNSWTAAEANPYEKRPQDSTRNRSLVDPQDFLKLDQEARRRGLEIISYYHSHPDHPARPSEFDLQHAFPYFVYVILAVEKGIPREMTAWLLSPDGSRFLPEEISIK